MQISYYPGCTVKTKGKGFEESALAALDALGVKMVELPNWNCCGTVFSLSSDDLVHHLAPLRNLLRVKELGETRVTTLCAMCYNTLKRANLLVQQDADKQEKIVNFMDDEETQYRGEVEVLHLLEFLRDEVGYENLSGKVTNPLKGLKVAPYYGCMLLRPSEIGVDSMEEPKILEDLMQTLGAEVIHDPMRIECCGSYHTVNAVETVADRTYAILGSALRRGADVVVQSCPLCDFNLDHRQKEVAVRYSGFRQVPVLYFTQLLALSLGLGVETCRFDLHYVDPVPLLKEKGLIQG